MECLNFVVCGQRDSAGPLAVRGGLCASCEMKFGEGLDVLSVGVESCPCCLEEESARVRMPQCSHRVCPECFSVVSSGSCPVCRGARRAPAWVHTGAPDCRCKRCRNHECANCRAICGLELNCTKCRRVCYCDEVCAHIDAQDHAQNCDRWSDEAVARTALVGEVVRLETAEALAFGGGPGRVWEIATYVPPRTKGGNGSFMLRTRTGTTGGWYHADTPADVVLGALESSYP